MSGFWAIPRFRGIDTTVEMVGANEVREQHLEGVVVDDDVFLLQFLPKKKPHQLAAFTACLIIRGVEGLRMHFPKQVVECGPVGFRHADQPPE